MRKELATLIQRLADWVSPDDPKSPLGRDDWTTVHKRVETASACLAEAESVMKDKALSDADAAFVQELALMRELSLDLRQQLESLDVRAGATPDGSAATQAEDQSTTPESAASGASSA